MPPLHCAHAAQSPLGRLPPQAVLPALQLEQERAGSTGTAWVAPALALHWRRSTTAASARRCDSPAPVAVTAAPPGSAAPRCSGCPAQGRWQLARRWRGRGPAGRQEKLQPGTAAALRVAVPREQRVPAEGAPRTLQPAPQQLVHGRHWACGLWTAPRSGPAAQWAAPGPLGGTPWQQVQHRRPAGWRTAATRTAAPVQTEHSCQAVPPGTPHGLRRAP